MADVGEEVYFGFLHLFLLSEFHLLPLGDSSEPQSSADVPDEQEQQQHVDDESQRLQVERWSDDDSQTVDVR